MELTCRCVEKWARVQKSTTKKKNSSNGTFCFRSQVGKERAQEGRKEKIRSALSRGFCNVQPNYHDSREETDCHAAGGVGWHVPVAHREEGDGHEPQGRVHFTRHFGGFPAGGRHWVSSWYEIVLELMDLVHKNSIESTGMSSLVTFYLK